MVAFLEQQIFFPEFSSQLPFDRKAEAVEAIDPLENRGQSRLSKRRGQVHFLVVDK
jgi:hypothetical protein